MPVSAISVALADPGLPTEDHAILILVDSYFVTSFIDIDTFFRRRGPQ